jgi:hypothetical protein
MKKGIGPRGLGVSPLKQTTYGEIMHQKSLKDKEMGKRTKVIDKAKAAIQAPFSDKTYSEIKKDYRKQRKAEYEAKNKK